MARLLTAPVTIVQGDDAPDIVITLQQDSSGTPYVLTDKAAFAVIVDTSDPENYVHKFEVAIEDESAGKVRISWLKDPVELTSYLEDLIPGRRYEVQVFLGRTNLPPSYVDVNGFDEYFNGRYDLTGAYQEGSPTYKHETGALFLSRSPYDGNGNPDEYVWLVTSLQAATWDTVKSQDKATLEPDDLELIPLWNYRQVLSAPLAPLNVLYPRLEVFEEDSIVITPTEKSNTFPESITVTGTGTGADAVYPYLGQSNDRPRYFAGLSDAKWSGTNWTIKDTLGNETWTHPTDSGNFPPAGLWPDIGNLGSPAPTVAHGEVLQNFTPTSIADLPTDVENRGTQTVLTQIPLIVKPAYRLAQAAT